MTEPQHVKALTEPPEPVEALAPIHYGKFTFTATGLLVDVDSRPTFEEWAEVGQVLAVMDRGIQFLIGDWIAYGEGAYKELAAQVVDARDWAEETVRNYRWLARQIPPENRYADKRLTVAHYQAVAPLTPREQRTWLRRALGDGDDRWSAGRLKAAIRNGADPEPTGFYVLVKCATEAKRDALQKQLELDGHECRAVTKR